MTITLLLNRVKVNLKDDLEKVVKYFSDHEIDIEFVTRETNLPLPQIVNNGNDNGQIQYVIKAKNIAKPFIAGDVTIFAFDAQEIAKPADGYITSSAGEGDSFITLKTDEYDDRTDWIWKAIAHELMHAIVKKMRNEGYFVADVMDSTWNPKENKYVSYWNNHDPYAKEGNFASQWKEIKRHKPKAMKYKYFTEREIKGLKPELVKMLDEARGIAGIPFIIESGLRAKDKNSQVGGVSNSAHLRGYAVDIRCRDSVARNRMLRAFIKVGFTRIGIGENFIHVDCDPTLPKDVIWHYYKKVI